MGCQVIDTVTVRAGRVGEETDGVTVCMYLPLVARYLSIELKKKRDRTARFPDERVLIFASPSLGQGNDGKTKHRARVLH